MFYEPVTKKYPDIAREYRSMIKEPMDFFTMLENVRAAADDDDDDDDAAAAAAAAADDDDAITATNFMS